MRNVQVMNYFAITASDPNNQPYFGLLNLPPKGSSSGMEVYHSAQKAEHILILGKKLNFASNWYLS